MAITTEATFQYIKPDDGHMWYLIMCNMPFFQGKLDWGCSIRGAWWKLYGEDTFEIRSCGLWAGDKQLLEPLKFNKEQWGAFIRSMSEFAQAEKGEGL